MVTDTRLSPLTLLFGLLDLLTDDFTNKITLKSKKEAGTATVTVETEKTASGVVAKVATKFTFGGISFDKVQVQADGGYALETSLAPVNGVSFNFKGSSKGSDIGLDYVTKSVFATAVLDAQNLSKVSASAVVVVADGINVGADTTYAISGTPGLAGVNLGASYAKGPLFASAHTSKKFSQVSLGVTYKIHDDLIVASHTAHSSSKPYDILGVGVKYNAPFGVIKAKGASDGVFHAALTSEVAPKVKVTASISALDLSTPKFTYGLGINI